MAEDGNESSEEEFEVVCITPENAESKLINGLITVDLSTFYVVENVPSFENNVQVIRMPTRNLKRIPDRFCQLKSLEELFLFGDNRAGLTSLPRDFGSLTNLKVLNLVSNCFLEFPAQICDLINLKELYLNDCGLKSIPQGIRQLKSLVMFDLSKNDFSSGICIQLFELESLKDLYLMECCLKELPEEIGKLSTLEGLRLNKNMLTHFPEQLYKLRNLKKLSATYNNISKLESSIVGMKSLVWLLLSGNKLKTLPCELSKLQCLKKLDVSENKLTCLPNSFVDLPKEFKIVINDNEFLQNPPPHICDKGIESIQGYFSSMAKSAKIHSNRMKVVVLGECGAGKTFLTHALVNSKACDVVTNDSTIGVEIHRCKFGEDKLESCIVDCAGQRRYQLTHPFFLSEEALHVIVVNLKTYDCKSALSFKTNVEDWIDWITARLKNPRIMIVGTHRDELTPEDLQRKCTDILEKIEKHEKKEMKRLDRAIERADQRPEGLKDLDRELSEVKNLKWQKEKRPYISSRLLPSSMENVKEQSNLNLVAVSSKEELKGMILLRREICRVARLVTEQGARLFSCIGIDLPESWMDLEKAISEFRHHNTNKVPCMTMEQFKKFSKDKADLEGPEVVSVLNYLDSIGEIKFYAHHATGNQYCVFLDLPWLCKVVKLLFRHDYEEEDSVEFNDDFRRFDMEPIKFEEELRDLKENGCLTLDLLKCLWMELNLKEDEIFYMIRSLVVFRLACEIPFQKNKLFIPWFLHSELDIKKKQKIFPDFPENDKLELKLRFSIVDYLPAGVFDRLCVRCYAIGIDITTWKNSMLIYQDDIQIYLEVVKTEITATGRSSKGGIKLLWAEMMKIVKELRNLLNEWPRLVYNTYTVCPQCIRNKYKKPCHFPCKWWNETQMGNARCKQNKRFLCEANLLFPPSDLLKGTEIPIIPVLVSDVLIRELSKQLPRDWDTLATHLGFEHNEISAIAANQNDDVVKMASEMFFKWKMQQGKEATTAVLIKALEKSGRRDLVSFVQDFDI